MHAKVAEPIEMPFGLRTRVSPGKYVRWGLDSPIARGNFGGKEEPIVSIETFCRDLCKNGRTYRFAVWIVDSGGPKEAQVQSYSPGGANVQTWEGTLAPPGNGAQMAIFYVIFAFCILSEPRAAHSKFALRSDHVWKYGGDPISDR